MTQTALSRPEAAAPIPPLADTTSAEHAEQRYMAAVEALVDEALDNRTVETLVDVMTWHLARIGFGFGPRAIGDIVRRLGIYLGQFDERQAAQREADEAKKVGRLPQ